MRATSLLIILAIIIIIIFVFLPSSSSPSLCSSFCRKCIYDKLSDEDVDNCPVCDIDLGCVPVEKLRPDHNLQNIIAKIFPLKGRKVEAPEIAPSASLPAKGKEDLMEDGLDGSSSSETLDKIIQNEKQGSSAKSSNDQIRDEHMDSNNEGREGKVDLCKPLNTLVEAGNRSKFSKSNLQGHSHPKGDPSNSEDSDIGTNKTRTGENGLRAEVQDDKSVTPSVQKPTKRNKLRPSKRNRSASQVVATEARRNWKDGPIWFSLVASEDQEGGEPLPQISAAFLRVKDGSMPVSFIQKYIVKKLDLANEAEVQIICEGHPVLPDLQLSSLLDAWLRISSTPKKVPTAVGDSAKEFVMILSYSKKVAEPTS